MRAAAVAALAPLALGAEQIHIALTGVPTEMHVGWADKGTCVSTSPISWGPTPSLGNNAAVSGYSFTESGLCLFDYTITGLMPQTTYYYTVGDSAMYSFVNQPVRDGGKVYAVYADFGLSNDVSITQLTTEASNGMFDAVIHAGDWAYDMEDYGGATGNSFMNAIQPIAASMPYMGSPGNHESDSNTFAQYKSRLYGYKVTANVSGSESQLWYSFNDGLVHWYSIDTELWAYGGTQNQIYAQYNWLSNDLANVNRSITPWVIGFGHKERWMDKVNFTGLDPIITTGNTDVYFCGHQHNYQRLYPTASGVVETDCVSDKGALYQDCKLPIILVVGSPGNKEKVSNATAPVSNLIATAFAYGYGHLTVANATHLRWQWEQTGQRNMKGEFVPKAGDFADDAWIVKSRN